MKYYLMKQWKRNLGITLLQIVYAGLSVALNVALIQIFQSIIERNIDQFIFWNVLNLGGWAVLLAVDGLRSWAINATVLAMNNQLREDIVASVLKKDHQAFHMQQSGEYISWLTNDVNQIEKLAWQPFYNMILTVLRVLFSVAVLAWMHWSLLAATLLAAGVIINTPKLFEKKIASLSKSCSQAQGKATGVMKDLLAGLDVLRSFGKTGRFIRHNQEASDQFEKAKYSLANAQVVAEETTSVVNILCQMAVNILIGVLSIQGVIIQSALMGCGNLCGMVYNGLASIGGLRLSFQASKPYFEKITEHAAIQPLREMDSLPEVEKEITMEHVNFRYGEKPVLNNLSMTFVKGGKYALTGQSGCGKSTVLKLLLGWLPEYTGSICFDGKNIRDFTTDQLQQRISYIEQNVFLFNSTIRDNITLGEKFSPEQLEAALRDSALEEDLIHMPLGLETCVGEDGSNLSGGQKQRVAIARALIHNRSILLVDEGTSALDQKNADIVEESLLRNPKLTLILVSHHINSERKAQFDRVYEMEPVGSSV